LLTMPITLLGNRQNLFLLSNYTFYSLSTLLRVFIMTSIRR
jgi:hypothetical protein